MLAKTRSLLPALALSGLLACCGDTEAPSVPKPAPGAMASVVFMNGVVYTLDANKPWADALAIRGDAIVYVGDSSSVTAFIGEGTETIDLAGRMLLPAFLPEPGAAASSSLDTAHSALKGIQETLTGTSPPPTVGAAIARYTLDRAQTAGIADRAGTLTRGKLADLVVLERNLFDVGYEDIGAVAVTLTMRDGRVGYRDGL